MQAPRGVTIAFERVDFEGFRAIQLWAFSDKKGQCHTGRCPFFVMCDRQLRVMLGVTLLLL